MPQYIADIEKHLLEFKKPAVTSRGSYAQKEVWLLKLTARDNPLVTGVGECSPFVDLSIDAVPHYESKLREICALITDGIDPRSLELQDYPSIQFGLETALQDLQHGGKHIIYPSEFVSNQKPIPINGLIWMDSKEEMLKQVANKIEEGYTCVKMKIGALDFDEECRMLETIRKHYSAFKIELRVDANGAFKPDTALEQLKELTRFELHSIEQPIKQKQWDYMQELCAKTPLPIALDEELIGVDVKEDGDKLLSYIKPQYIILKPSLIGGFKAGQAWIDKANKHTIGWWVTSALESNIGLNAIAQWTATLNSPLPQGLGTGKLFKNNFTCPLDIHQGHLYYRKDKNWA